MTRATATRLLCILLVLCGSARSAVAQDAPPISFRPFGEVAFEHFTAKDTFQSVFGSANGWFYGGGLQITLHDRIYVDLAVSQFKKDGDRVFRDSSGNVYNLGIPLTATLTPFELVGGYRFHPHGHAWLVPYVGAGPGWYRYRETSDFAQAGDNIDTRHVGVVAHAGAEFRIHRWVGLAADLQYTHVPDILGSSGLSAALGENDLGGIAGRFKIVIGK